MKEFLGLFIAFAIGAACRYFAIPVPSPNRLLGALLVLAITLGYVCVDQWLAKTHGMGASKGQISQEGDQ